MKKNYFPIMISGIESSFYTIMILAIIYFLLFIALISYASSFEKLERIKSLQKVSYSRIFASVNENLYTCYCYMLILALIVCNKIGKE